MAAPPGLVAMLNEYGEVCLRGPQVMRRYWKNPEETAKVMRDGWLLTGDIGYMDDDGFLFIVDRKKDMLITATATPRQVSKRCARLLAVLLYFWYTLG